MISTLITSMILVLAVICHKVGAPEILGSFAAGIALARRFFLPLGTTIEHYSRAVADKIEQGMTPIIDLFVPVFFVMVGVSPDRHLLQFVLVVRRIAFSGCHS